MASVTPRCPVCSTPISLEEPEFPFCSPRCRLVDLGRWLNEEYSLPAPVTERDADEFERAVRDRERREQEG
ncbi:MAG: DNA gyrase inhibitor YacG [Myxococcota bacterium]